MCRHLAYLGTPVTLAEMVTKPEHGLLEQTWAPRDMRDGGTMNVDGFGVGWFDGDEVTRYRSVNPMWTDATFLELCPHVRGSALLAAARSATPGMPNVETACAPFTDGTWLFSHNGKITGWPESVADVASRLDTVRLLSLEALTDSALLWELLRQRLGEGEPPEVAVSKLTAEINAVAPESRLNLLLTDGTRLIATTWTHSLWAHRDEHGVLLSSEPFGTSDGWCEIPDGHLVHGDRWHLTTTPLDRDLSASRTRHPTAR